MQHLSLNQLNLVSITKMKSNLQTTTKDCAPQNQEHRLPDSTVNTASTVNTGNSKQDDVNMNATAEPISLEVCSEMLSPQHSGAMQIFFVWSTIKANPDITLNQLRWLMSTEFILEQSVVDSAVAALTSKSLLNCVSKWQVHGKDVFHLKVKNPDSSPPWLVEFMAQHPELHKFEAPVFIKKRQS